MKTQQLEDEKHYTYSATLRAGIWKEGTWHEPKTEGIKKSTEPRDSRLLLVDDLIDRLLRDTVE